jgi:hypothetical protein
VTCPHSKPRERNYEKKGNVCILLSSAFCHLMPDGGPYTSSSFLLRKSDDKTQAGPAVTSDCLVEVRNTEDQCSGLFKAATANKSRSIPGHSNVTVTTNTKIT